MAEDFANKSPDTRRAITTELTVLLGDEAYAARVTVTLAAVTAAPPFTWNAAVLSSLGGMTMTLPVVACVSRVTATDVAALRPADVVIPAAWPLKRDGTGWRGAVLLAAPHASTGVGADLGEGDAIVLRGEPVSLDAAEADMAEADGSPAIVDAVGEVPVVVRVEVGEVRMAAKDWAALGRGDVITLGQRVGARVALRVGGIVLARGELVEIDGEVGVRVVERVHEEPVRS